jgi:molybdopterin synthase catalytic subunit
MTIPTSPVTSDAVHIGIVDAIDGQPDPMAALAFVSDDAFGGIDLFVGRVRAANQGRTVTGIHYDLFDPLALNVLRRSAEAAIASHGPSAKAYVAHAKGRLRVGDVAVVVAFATPHRDAAFRGCREVIEVVKHEAPIWKQEHYVGGSSEWSEGCALCVERVPEPVPAPEPDRAPEDHAPVPVASDCCGCGLGHAGGPA